MDAMTLRPLTLPRANGYRYNGIDRRESRVVRIKANGSEREVTSLPDTPLLYVLRGELGVMTPKFGCGLAQCGACSVLLGDEEIRACITPISALEGKEVATVDGLPARWAKTHPAAGKDALHPVQEAWIEQQVPQCGICQFGMIIKVTELLETNPSPSDAEIKDHLTNSGPSPHLCRCGSYAVILEGAHRAAKLMRGDA